MARVYPDDRANRTRRTSGAAGTRDSLERLAWILDSSIPLPGGFRIGLDGLIGLIPGVGDAAGALISSYIITQAAKLGAPKTVLARMGINVILETLIGLIPIVGDLFDFAWKANQRNIRLLDEYMLQPRQTRTRSGFMVGLFIAALLIVLIFVIWVGLALLNWLWTVITT